MAASDSALTYRPYLNRHRVVFVLHGDAGECETIAGAFTAQGFITSTALTLEGLVRLIELRRPDVIIADIENARREPDFMSTLRTLAFGVRIFLLAESNPEAVEVVKAVHSGALSVFVKPFQLAEMLRTVSDELKHDVRAGEGPHAMPNVQGIAALTQRELEVLQRVVSGETNKKIATALSISPRTVEVHRGAAMRKLGARNTADLVRLTLNR